MADFYTTTGSETTVQVLSQTESRKVERVGILTKPSGVRLLVNVPYAAFVAGNEAKYLEPPALLTEQLMGNDTGEPLGTAIPLAVSAAFVQKTDASDLLADYVRFTVQYVPADASQGPFNATVDIPMTALSSLAAFSLPIAGGKSAQQLLLDAQAKLEKLANL